MPGDRSQFIKSSTGQYERTLPDGTVYVYSAPSTDPSGKAISGKLEMVRDRYGNETKYAYDAAGKIQSITDPVGLVTKFGYSGDHVSEIARRHPDIDTAVVSEAALLLTIDRVYQPARPVEAVVAHQSRLRPGPHAALDPEGAHALRRAGPPPRSLGGPAGLRRPGADDRRERLVVVDRAGVEAEPVLEAGAAAALDVDAQLERVVAFFGDELADLRRGSGGELQRPLERLVIGC